MDSVKEIVFSGTRWLIFRQLFGQAIRIITSLILTTLIVPEDFGLVAKVLGIFSFFEVFLTNIFTSSLIQKKQLLRHEVATIFFIHNFITFLFCAILFLSAPLISSFYNDDQARWLVQMFSISLLFLGLRSIPEAKVQRDLRFKESAIINITSIIISSGFAIYLATIGFGYEALAVQHLLLNIFMALGFLMISGVRYKYKFLKESIKYHYIFSRNLLLTNFLNIAIRNADNIALGKFQSDLILGYYSRAYSLMYIPVINLSQIINSTLFPVLSRIQDDKEKVSRLFNRIQEAILIAISPVFIWLYFNIDLIIIGVLGRQWEPSIIYFKIFMPLMMLQVFTSSISNIYLSFNRTQTLLKIGLFIKPIIIVTIVFSAMKGAYYVALFFTILSSIGSLLTYVIGYSFLGATSLKKHLKMLKNNFIKLIGLGVLIVVLSKIFTVPFIFLIFSSSVTLLFIYINIRFNKELMDNLYDLFKLGKN